MIKKRIKIGIFAGLVLFVLIVGIINIVCENISDFWNLPLASCLTIIVTLVVSYYFTKKNADERNQKEILLHIMEKMQGVVTDKSLYEITKESDIKYVLMKKREINNYTTLLGKYSKQFNFSGDIKFIEEKVLEYVELIGNHQDDREYLEKSRTELLRPLELIDQRLNEAKMNLFI